MKIISALTTEHFCSDYSTNLYSGAGSPPLAACTLDFPRFLALLSLSFHTCPPAINKCLLPFFAMCCLFNYAPNSNIVSPDFVLPLVWEEKRLPPAFHTTHTRAGWGFHLCPPSPDRTIGSYNLVTPTTNLSNQKTGSTPQCCSCRNRCSKYSA